MLERIVGYLPLILLFAVPALIALRRAGRQRRAARGRAAAQAQATAQAAQDVPSGEAAPQAPRPTQGTQYVYPAPLQLQRLWMEALVGTGPGGAAASAAKPMRPGATLRPRVWSVQAPARGRTGNSGQRLWGRLGALPPLQRAVALSEILGRPRGLEDPGDFPLGGLGS